MTKELIQKFSRDIEELTLKRVDIALDIIRYREHNPEKDCFCEVCKVIWAAKNEIRKVFANEEGIKKTK